MADLRLVSVAKHYAGHPVLHDLSLELGRGELLSLLGPSGCGKTTLLRIIAGFETADGGRVYVGDQDVSALPANRRGLGMVFQAYSLFPNMTAAENVRFGLHLRRVGADEQRRRAGDMLDLVGLAGHADKYPHQLSGGQQQRVALARALAIRPALLLLDEPLSALDAKVRVQLREEIRRIQRETGITTVFVTHDQEEALSVSDRVAVMHQGRLVQVGTPAEIYDAPTHPFVARFIGTSSRLPASLVDPQDGLIRIHDQHWHAPPARGLAAQSALDVFLRPEDVRLAAARQETPSGSVLAGTVRERTFLGAITRLRVDLDAGGPMLADLSTAAAAALPIGARVHACWDPDAMRILPAAADA
jgi:putative spermidine/putrescine transport system ATP-binding protein